MRTLDHTYKRLIAILLPMTRLGDARVIGGIGSILLFFPGVSIVGLILVFIAVKYISDEVQDKSIFDNMLIALIAGIIGLAATAFIVFTGALFSVFTLGLSAILGIIVSLAIGWIFLIVSALYVRKAYTIVGTKLNINAFKTTATLWFWGAALTIILVGFIILFVAYIFQAIAYFSIQETPQTQPSAVSVQQGMATKFCPSCGTQIPQSSTFCPKCGAKQP